MLPIRLRFSVYVALTLTFAGSGCSRARSWRQRYFARPETAVPMADYAPQPGEPGLDVNAGGGRARSDLIGRRRAGAAGVVAWQQIGESVQGRAIEIVQFGNGARRVLLIGGIHGDEPEGLPLIEQLAEEFAVDQTLTRGATVQIVRDLNPDGTAASSRTNSNGVDLNRNFPASNWDAKASSARMNPGPRAASEPETRVLIEVIRDFQPDRILVMHATRGKPMVNYDGPARQLAESLSQLNGYVTSDTIGYPTPGSLGSYAGIDMQIPIITLELPRGIDAEQAWQANREAIYRLIR
jgi:predicted deacylase